MIANRVVSTLSVGLLLGASALAIGHRARADDVRVVPKPALAAPAGEASLTLSGGCFWGIQGVFEHVRGVTRAVAGYTGGSADTATYEQVSTGATGHAESVQITYDPRVIDAGRLLQIFFSVALDPTETDRQGPDEGSQYRSEVWAADPAQAQFARRYIAELDAAHVFPAPIATRVDTLHGFYPAESYHQDYLVRNPDSEYIAINDAPKVAALQKLFPADYVARPVLVNASGS